MSRTRTRQVLAALLAVVAVFVAILVIRALTLNSLQIEVGPGTASPPLVVDENAAAARLAEALRFRTISREDPPGFDHAPFERMVTWLQETYPSVYKTVRVEKRAGPSLLLRWPGKNPSLQGGLFMSHLDVVPVEPGTEQDWTHPPFAGTVAEGFVWGRGALDIKCGVVGLHEAIALLITHGIHPERDLWFAFGHDEEIGGASGNKVLAEWMVQQGLTLAFVVDEGGYVLDGAVPELGERPLAMIDVAEKGYVTVELCARSGGGHSSMPPDTTAVGRIARAIARLEADPFPATIDGVVGQQLDHMAPELPFVRRLALANRWLFASVILQEMARLPQTNAIIRTSTAATMMHGGVQDNVIPQSATGIINFRTLPGVTADDVLARVKCVIDDPEVEARPTQVWISPAPAAVETQWYRAAARAAREEYRDAVVAPGLLVATTDSRYYQALTKNIYRFLGMRMHMDDVAGIHGTNERIAVAGYARGIKILTRMLQYMGASANEH